MHSLITQLTRPAKVLCTPCSGERGRDLLIDAQHDLYSPATGRAIAHLPSATLRAFLRETDGAVFFHTGEPAPRWSNGLKILSGNEIDAAHHAMRRMLQQTLRDHPAQWRALQESSPIDLQAWYHGLIPIAAPLSSPDLVVLDTCNADDPDEAQCLLLDQALFGADPDDEDVPEVRWQSFQHFFEAFVSWPTDFLEPSWRYTEPESGTQYLPQAVIYLNH